jgi:hypothetical protein
MAQRDDLSRSAVGLDHDSTLIAVIEMSQSSWLVAGIVPGIDRHPLVWGCFGQEGNVKLWRFSSRDPKQRRHGVKGVAAQRCGRHP